MTNCWVCMNNGKGDLQVYCTHALRGILLSMDSDSRSLRPLLFGSMGIGIQLTKLRDGVLSRP